MNNYNNKTIIPSRECQSSEKCLTIKYIGERNVFKSVQERVQSSLPRLQGGCDQLDLRKARGLARARAGAPRAEVRADRYLLSPLAVALFLL